MMKKCLLLSISVLLACGLQAQLQDLEVRRNFKRADIPYRYINGFMVVSVTFNEFFPLNFIFDTGAEYTILTKREITDLLQADYRRRFTLMGSDLSTELYAYLVQGVSLKVGDVLAMNRSILVLEEDYMRFEDYAGVDIHGILGADFFRRFVVQIDYRRQVVSLYEPKAFELPNKFQAIPVTYERSKPYLEAQVVTGGKDTSMLKFLIDTGAALPLLINTESREDLALPEQVVPSNLGAGLGGFLVGYKGRVSRLSFPPYEFSEVVTSFQDLPLRLDSLKADERNGIIGNEILRRFTVIFDYIGERMYLAPNKAYDEEFVYDRSGLLVIAAGPNLSEFIIYSVLEDSPAAGAGLQPGDRILSINFVPRTFLSLEGIIGRLQKRPGRRIRISVKRDGERLRKTFLLRDLI